MATTAAVDRMTHYAATIARLKKDVTGMAENQRTI